jgi:hypothetical protein
VYIADKEEKSETEHSVHDETSDQPDTTEFTSTLKQPRYSYEPSSYDVEFPRVFARGQTPNYPIEDYTELKEEGQNVHYISSKKHPYSVDKFSPLVKDSHQHTIFEEPQKMKDSFQLTRSENSYKANLNFNTTTFANSYKLEEPYVPTTTENPHTLRESFQTTTLENPYKLLREYYQNLLPGNKTDPQEDPKSKRFYSYNSLESQISPEEESAPHIQNTASSARKYPAATGRETNPYTYFYVGRKLWYIPLFFSVYFMVYVFALVVRSIARHKIVFPTTHIMSDKRDLNSEQMELQDITQQVTTALEKTVRLYM